MRKRVGTNAFVLAILAAMLVAIPAAPAAAAPVVADWQMNESSGARTMVDSSGNGIHGSIGSAIRTGIIHNGAKGYRWTHTAPNQPPPKPERLIQVNDGRLNPGTGDYAIEVRFRTTRKFGNIIQKGQANTRGGYFKWQIPNGKLTCLFRGYDSNGVRRQRSVNSGDVPLNDGQWHTVRCERRGNQMIMTIDNARTRRAWGNTASISNNIPLTIGGKKNCNQDTITCDYFVGDIDYVKIEGTGAGGGGNPPPPPPPPPPPNDDTIFEDDFSSGMSRWTRATRVTASGGTANVDVSNQSAYAYRALGAAYQNLCASVDVNETQLGRNVLMRLKTASSGPIGRVVVDSSGRLRVRSDVSGQRTGALGQLGSGWHNIELCVAITGGSDTWNLYRDGVRILTGWSANSGSTGVGRVYIGDTSRKTWEASFDNMVVDQQPG